ncbi:putative bifunctional diguanylate cyclase/phosphodiesterase [Novosphingobium rosa]|uniref:putative bifunctional diguanylate cyclase/phosphodiesterase n=1 Tax=Novosphingobium rosa TaxID=76978 RepID=UPI0008335B2F|nr:bifunctional diguanylate cyclase/phosphodiesterase [Novosphingobium rosa]
MNGKATIAGSGELGILSVLGLAGRGDDTSAHVLGAQQAQLTKVARIRLLTQAPGAFVVLALYAQQLGWAPMLGWLVALAASLGLVTYAERRSSFAMQGTAIIANALVWAAVLWFFVPQGTQGSHFEIWTVLATLMTVSALVLPTAPLATLLFSAIVGGAAIGSFVQGGYDAMAGVAALFVSCIALGTMESARSFLAARITAASIAERDEVVSLLLRESEDEADWLWQSDARHRVRDAGRRFADALGLSAGEIEGQGLLHLISGSGDLEASDSGLIELAGRLGNREGFAGLVLPVLVMGRRRWWEMSGAPRFDGAGTFEGFHGVISDVTEKRESAERIARLARYDTLTGLPNRMMLTETLATALAAGGGALMMLDLDRFKAVNDTLGHPVGDALLAQVGQRLTALMAPGEMVGRLGGDEFAVVLPAATDDIRLGEIARGILRDLSRSFMVSGHTLSIGVSVGSAVGPRDGASVEDLMRHADMALYRSKETGRGRHVAYGADLRADAQERLEQEEALRRAIENEDFVLQYQPVVDLVSERVVGFEALLRWQHPERGLVGPDTFVPLAEACGLIVPIGQWVLAAAVREAARWTGPVRVAVNVAPLQLMAQDFVEGLVQVLATSGLPPQRLEIEVTESIFEGDAERARAVLERVLALGCCVCLDDFGSGHASLDYLRKLHFSAIKIDRGFVKGALAGHQESLATVRAIVAMTHGLEMASIAEGVETAEELALMRDLGCTRVQGYYFGRPMDSSAIDRLFARQKQA